VEACWCASTYICITLGKSPIYSRRVGVRQHCVEAFWCASTYICITLGKSPIYSRRVGVHQHIHLFHLFSSSASLFWAIHIYVYIHKYNYKAGLLWANAGLCVVETTHTSTIHTSTTHTSTTHTSLLTHEVYNAETCVVYIYIYIYTHKYTYNTGLFWAKRDLYRDLRMRSL